MMSLWLSFIVMAALNLALGVATAIYFRRYIDVVRAAAKNSDNGRLASETQTTREGLTPKPTDPGDPSSATEKKTPVESAAETFPGQPEDGGIPATNRGKTDPETQDSEIPETSPEEEPVADDETPTREATSRSVTNDVPDTLDTPETEDGVPPNGTTETEESDLSSVAHSAEGVASSEQETDIPPGSEPSSSPVLKLLQQTDRVIDQLRQLHDQLFSHSPTDREALAALLSGVEPTVEELVGQYHQVLPNIVSASSSSPPEEILSHLHQQVLALQQAEIRLTSIDLRGDFNATVKEIQAECSHLMGSAHGFRDALEAVYAHETANSDSPPALTSPLCYDRLTGVFNRVGLERFLQTHTLGRLARERLTAVLFDLDQFARINQRFGHRLGDQTLAAVAKVFQQTSLRHATWVRYGGDQFLLLLRETDVRQGVQEAEHLRQQFEVAQFVIGEDTVHLTLSAAVTELRSDDTPTAMFLRLLETLREAKRAGGNRTFAHNGQSAAPVVPPNLRVEEQTYQVSASITAAEQAAAVEEAFHRG
ncbi:MAG: GGDEF domain-containing protein [Thermogutta sp.]